MKNSILLTSVLAGSLILTPLSGIINNNNVAKAVDIQNNNINISNKKIKKVVTFSNSDIIKIIEKEYKNKKISEKDFISTKSIFQDRWGPSGETKVVIFSDGAFDLYLNSYYAYAIASMGITSAGVAIGALIIAAGFSGGASLFAAGAISSFLGMIAGTELSKGVIVYFKKLNPNLMYYYPHHARQQ